MLVPISSGEERWLHNYQHSLYTLSIWNRYQHYRSLFSSYDHHWQAGTFFPCIVTCSSSKAYQRTPSWPWLAKICISRSLSTPWSSHYELSLTDLQDKSSYYIDLNTRQFHITDILAGPHCSLFFQKSSTTVCVPLLFRFPRECCSLQVSMNTVSSTHLHPIPHFRFKNTVIQILPLTISVFIVPSSWLVVPSYYANSTLFFGTDGVLYGHGNNSKYQLTNAIANTDFTCHPIPLPAKVVLRSVYQGVDYVLAIDQHHQVCSLYSSNYSSGLRLGFQWIQQARPWHRIHHQEADAHSFSFPHRAGGCRSSSFGFPHHNPWTVGLFLSLSLLDISVVWITVDNWVSLWTSPSPRLSKCL